MIGMHNGFPTVKMIDTMDRRMESLFTYCNDLACFPERMRDRYSEYNTGRTPPEIRGK